MVFKEDEKDLQTSPVKTNANLKSIQKKVLDARTKLTEAEKEVARLKKMNNEAKRKIAAPPNYEIFKGSTNPDTPVDVFYETLKFLNRNEPIILRSGGEFLYSNTKFHYQFVDCLGEVQQKILTKAIAMHGFKNAIVENFNVEVRDKVDEKFQAYFKSLEKRIDVVTAYFEFPRALPPRYTVTADIRKNIRMIKTILDDILKVRNLKIQFYHDFASILHDPQLIEFLKSYENVRLYGCLTNKVCLCEQLSNFINTNVGNLTCFLDPPYCHRSICAKIVENLIENDNITSVFIKRITFNPNQNNTYEEDKTALAHLRSALTTHHATYKKDNEKEPIEKYELGRSDGWKLRVSIPNCYMEELSEFTIDFFQE
uniref:Uncharacterized protein n=1 Tax=Acrobeloides nanus TaxID=290746 RepID=A0A914D6P0_9BILA